MIFPFLPIDDIIITA